MLMRAVDHCFPAQHLNRIDEIRTGFVYVQCDKITAANRVLETVTSSDHSAYEATYVFNLRLLALREGQVGADRFGCTFGGL